MQLKQEHHQFIYFLGLILLAVGLPLSKFLMSIAQFVLVINWLWEGDIKNKLQKFWNNRSAVLLSSIFLLHLIGLLYTTDYAYAFNDIRIKLPLLVLPLIISSSPPLSKIKFHWLMSFFVLSVFSGTLVSTFVFLFWHVDDIRNISPFISHIRFGLNICIAIFTLFYFISKSEQKVYVKVLLMALMIWLVCFLFILESVTGVVIFVFSACLLLVYFTFREKKWLQKMAYLLLLLSIPVLIITYINSSINQLQTINPIDLSHMELNTAHGEEYKHNFKNKQLENGNYVWIYIAWDELERTWNKRSKLDFNGKDKKDQPLSATLIRFLTSKRLRKDAEGMSRLTHKEVKAIENGIANVNYMNSNNFQTRIEQIIWEFDNYFRGGNPEGNSVTQRIEFGKAAIGIIKKNWIIGVGTGDVQSAYNNEYPLIKTLLSSKYWLRAHNQYLTILVTFGMLGFLWFMISIFYPLFKAARLHNFFFILFFIIALLSFINEDTLETQAGATFFAFFYCLFLFGRKK